MSNGQTVNKYIHDPNYHNFKSAEEIVPVILKYFNISSVLDVGCGTGTWLHVFMKHGVNDALGIDGEHLNLDQLVIDRNNVLLKDLEQSFSVNRKFDLTISLEVAEHLIESSADTFVDSLTATSDIVIFSAAIVNQGGQNHINEQWPSYWIDKFKQRGYADVDLIRPEIWDNWEVFLWYKQNMLCFIKESSPYYSISKTAPRCLDIVHPWMFLEKTKQLEDTFIGRKGIRHSFRIFLNSIGYFFSAKNKSN